MDEKYSPIKESLMLHMKAQGGGGSCFQYWLSDIVITDEMQEEINEEAAGAVFKKFWEKTLGSSKKKVRADPQSYGQQELIFNGLPCPGNISFRDPDMPGGWATVLAECASVWQFRMSINGHDAITADMVAANRQLNDALDVMEARCNGDEQMLIIALTDDYLQEVV